MTAYSGHKADERPASFVLDGEKIRIVKEDVTLGNNIWMYSLVLWLVLWVAYYVLHLMKKKRIKILFVTQGKRIKWENRVYLPQRH